jgi:SNF2 family DNA or RNA helicase
VEVNGVELVGDTDLTKRLYSRQLCGQYSKEKLEAFRDLLQSTNDRIVVFYNFKDEAVELMKIANSLKKPWCVIDGRNKNLAAYENFEDAVVFVQYQAGAMGLNLQKSNKIIFYSLPDGRQDLFDQAVKRIHRIGQTETCFYYLLICRDSVEEDILKTLEIRKNYTEELFKEVKRK